jgi:hypothetical protein
LPFKKVVFGYDTFVHDYDVRVTTKCKWCVDLERRIKTPFAVLD